MTKASTSIHAAQMTPAPVSHEAMSLLHGMASKHLASQEKFKEARAHTALSKGYASLHLASQSEHPAEHVQAAIGAAKRAEGHSEAGKVYGAGIHAHAAQMGSPMAKAHSDAPNAPGYGVPEHEINHEPKMLHTLPTGEKVHPQSVAAVNDLDERFTGPADAAVEHGKAHLGHVMKGLNVTIKGRAKDAPSIGGKIANRGYGAEHMTDVAGLRVTVHDPAHMAEAQRRLQSHRNGTHPMSGGHGFEVHTEEDHIKTPMDSGYRRVHYQTKSLGTATEVQLGHPHQTAWADYAHDHFYKDHALKEKLASTGHSADLGAVKEAGASYSKAVADHLDKTGGVKGPDAPKTPPILEKHGLGFPWHKL